MKNDRISEYKIFIEKFLKHHNYDLKALPVDCSFRSYHKVVVGDSTYMLMDCPPGKEDIRPFAKVTQILRDFGFSAPEIYYADYDKGLALIEDFGDNLLKKLLLEKPHMANDLYKNSIDTLISIQQKSHDKLDLNIYDNDMLLEEVLLFIEWYYPALFGHDLPKKSKEKFIDIWLNLFDKIHCKYKTMVLRDYHVENLMFLEGRKKSQTIGLLDYQDAVIGANSYDLVSLLEDARIDVKKPFREQMITYYISQSSNIDYKDFLSDYAILGVQRNCKIIGIFSRKAIRDKKSSYLQYLPRVWSYINDAINHPILIDVKQWMISEKIPFIRVG